MPFDTRAIDERDELGNHIVNLRVPLPCDEKEPRTRLTKVVQACAAEEVRHIATMEAGIRSLPSPLVRAFFALTAARRHSDLTASNTGWLEDPLSFNGKLSTWPGRWAC